MRKRLRRARQRRSFALVRAVNESLSVNSIDIINRINEYKNIVREVNIVSTYCASVCEIGEKERKREKECGMIYRMRRDERVWVYKRLDLSLCRFERFF